MSEQLLAVLRLCLLGLIYLFFLRVLRAVWVEVHGPRRVRAPKQPRAAAPVPVSPLAGGPGATGATTMLATSPPAAPTETAQPSGASRRTVSLRITAPPELAGQTFVLADETTLGRAPGCRIQLDDTYVSQVHARVSRSGDELIVEDLGSTNGTYVNRSKVTEPTPLREGDRLQVGNVVMELV